MKKVKTIIIAMLFIGIIVLPSCATILGGPVSSCQRTKPQSGEPQRAVRAGALIADIFLFWPGLIVDFATGAIYKPCSDNY